MNSRRLEKPEPQNDDQVLKNLEALNKARTNVSAIMFKKGDERIFVKSSGQLIRLENGQINEIQLSSGEKVTAFHALDVHAVDVPNRVIYL